MKEKLIKELTDEIMKAIYPAMIRRQWIESVVQKIVEKYSIS